MKFRIKDLIFTDKTKAGKDLINKSGDKFYMLHLEVIEDEGAIIKANEHGKWISKYYSEKKDINIEVGKVYNINYSNSGIYKNILSVTDLDDNKII